MIESRLNSGLLAMAAGRILKELVFGIKQLRHILRNFARIPAATQSRGRRQKCNYSLPKRWQYGGGASHNSAMLIKRKSIEAPASTKAGVSRQVKKPAAPTKSCKPKLAPITISELDGVRFLHSGTEWVQGAMRICNPEWIELEYAQQMMAWMLFTDRPRHIVQLGLGTGALTKFCYRQFPQAQVTAVELNPSVIMICQSMFMLPPDDERLTVIEADAMDFIADPARTGTIEALQVDLYDGAVRGPVLDTPEFYQACANSLATGGVMTVNLFGEHLSYVRNFEAMRTAFDQVVCLQALHEGNVVVIAFKDLTVFDFIELHQRARQIMDTTRLPTKSWVNGIKAATGIS